MERLISKSVAARIPLPGGGSPSRRLAVAGLGGGGGVEPWAGGYGAAASRADRGAAARWCVGPAAGGRSGGGGWTSVEVAVESAPQGDCPNFGFSFFSSTRIAMFGSKMMRAVELPS